LDRVILTDVDNTLFSWIDYFAPCFRALVHAISREAKLSEEDLYASFQTVFQREGTVEFRKAIQENLLVKSLPIDQQERLIHIGKVAFGQASNRHLRPYPSVIPTLKRLRQDGIWVVAVTNSDVLQAMYRLRRLGVAKLLNGLVAWDHDVSGITDSASSYGELFATRLRNSGLPWAKALPEDRLKPNVAAYEEALNRIGVRKADIWIIGDSLAKDLTPAFQINATAIWAKYGHSFDEKNFNTLIQITHWSEERIRATYDKSVLKPDHIAEDFTQLLDFVDLRQPTLF